MAELFGGTGKWVPMSPTPKAAAMVGQQGQAHTSAFISNKDTAAAAAAFGGGEIMPNPLLRYPESVGVAPDQGHWIIFDIFVQESAQLKAQKTAKAVKSKIAAVKSATAAAGGGTDLIAGLTPKYVKLILVWHG